MLDLKELRQKAEGLCGKQGHTIKWSPPFFSESQALQSAVCTACPAWVQVNTEPKGLSIGGPALSKSCPVFCEPLT